MGYIYKITNDINDKIYIGKTTRSVELRFQEHCKADFQTKSILHKAIQKYGKEHFFVELLEEVKNDELNNREKYWITYYDSQNKGYNLTAGGEGRSLSELELKNIRFLWEEGKNIKEICSQLNLKHSTVYHRVCQYSDFDPKENRKRALKYQQIPICQYDFLGNLIQTYNSLAEASEKTGYNSSNIIFARDNGTFCHGYLWANLGAPLPVIKTNKKIVFQYDLDYNLINIYQSAREAARMNQVDSSCIIRCCNHQQKTSKGYIYSYEKIDSTIKSS